MKQQRAYHYRFYPTDEQARLLAHTFGCARYVYNFALRLRTDAYYKEQQRIGYHETSARLTLLKQQYEKTLRGHYGCRERTDLICGSL